MANKWGIPKETEESVIKRDLACVYCGVSFSIEHKSRKTKPTWEHIVNDIRINSIHNIALCCTSCNASKGAKLLEDWLKSAYCNSKSISKETVSQVIKNALENPPKLTLKE
ncbi:HNH endonuclease [Polaribacter gangjinensis]|uniref:HNH endonuclease n=1 Tax=Polaribacter gangjinensis TaxID=574710 RepID=A0A2S7W9Y5_9FLAO|nr:HNH endonuclease domain-containing protein [Polaribacter gangjinensis]PQJ74435.1 HNH endonuclease [Polaribacter gangjinensis]